MSMAETGRGRARVALLALLVGGLVACGGDERATADVEGTWAIAADTAGEVFLRISAESISVWREDTLADCFERIDYDILGDPDGTRFRVTTSDEDAAFTIRLRRDDEDLIVDAFGQEVRYEASTVDPETLLVCEPTSPDVDCATLTPIAVGDTTEGSIEAADDENPNGSHYDLYRLQLGGPAELRIDMESNELDSYLLLFDSATAVVDENDDASNLTLDARLENTFGAGCYILMAASRFADDFGDYRLRVIVP